MLAPVAPDISGWLPILLTKARTGRTFSNRRAKTLANLQSCKTLADKERQLLFQTLAEHAHSSVQLEKTSAASDRLAYSAYSTAN